LTFQIICASVKKMQRQTGWWVRNAAFGYY